MQLKLRFAYKRRRHLAQACKQSPAVTRIYYTPYIPQNTPRIYCTILYCTTVSARLSAACDEMSFASLLFFLLSFVLFSGDITERGKCQSSRTVGPTAFIRQLVALRQMTQDPPSSKLCPQTFLTARTIAACQRSHP